jgi:hypothetical protein
MLDTCVKAALEGQFKLKKHTQMLALRTRVGTERTRLGRD